MKEFIGIKKIRKFSGRVINLNLETVGLPDGSTLDMEIVHHAGGSAIVAIDDQHQVCLVYQYRHALGAWIWEIPAGKIDANETPESTAHKELQEETGTRAKRWKSLGKMYATPGYSNEIIHLYLAQGLSATAIQHEAGELMEIHWKSLDEAIEWALNGKINDAKTVLALLRARKEV